MTRIWRVSLFALALGCTFSSNRIDADQWTANWISPAKPGTRQNSWFSFRKSQYVKTAPKHFIIKIACDSKYWLWINDKLVVREGGLKRGPTPTSTYFDRVDIGPDLRPGNNEIAVLVWHFGKHGFSHNDSGKVGLIIDGQDNHLTLMTDATWHATRHPAFENANNPPPNYRLPEGNLRFDARKDLVDWQTSNAFEKWPSALECGFAGDQPWGQLHERPIPQWKDMGVSDYRETTETSAGKLTGLLPRFQGVRDNQRVLIGKLPYNAHVHPRITLSAPAGLKIDIQTDLVIMGTHQTLTALS